VIVMRAQSLVIIFFFFSSRRRHTRSYGDWSSDVCSSDLHRCPCGSARGALFSGSVTARCRTRSRGPRARALAAPIPIPPAGAGSQTVRPQGPPKVESFGKVESLGLTSQVLWLLPTINLRPQSVLDKC